MNSLQFPGNIIIYQFVSICPTHLLQLFLTDTFLLHVKIDEPVEFLIPFLCQMRALSTGSQRKGGSWEATCRHLLPITSDHLDVDQLQQEDVQSHQHSTVPEGMIPAGLKYLLCLMIFVSLVLQLPQPLWGRRHMGEE